KKLSKRDFAKSLRDYRREGKRPEDVLGEAAWRVGLLKANTPLSAAEAPGLFLDVTSAFDIPSLNTKVAMTDILDSVRE
ncbi:MAG: hypothetical protein L3K26_19265, partial [Candidatus Hydrogenedentes bacterium]|nr:hypothetical protein [Candidatus Hydrogenedentota bacterium]